MRKLLLLLLLPFISAAQESITAGEIIQMINEGKQVNFKTFTVEGVLDLTELNNKEKLQNRETTEFKSLVVVSLAFEDCTFLDDIIGYKNSNEANWKNNVTSTTDFDNEVSFKNCNFKGEVAMKYSDFREGAVFEGCNFSKDANFKYAKFKEFAGFGNVSFQEGANFKYANFNHDADFYNNRFNSFADFKYAEFRERATFKKSMFYEDADFKYTKFKVEGVFVNAEFQGEADFKYTTGKVYKN